MPWIKGNADFLKCPTEALFAANEAAFDAQLVHDLREAGMDVMRIHCADDGPEVWAAMVQNLRRVNLDLAVPKRRTRCARAKG